ncbi:MAG: hypothetical protein AB1330_10805 [Bacillota bacterium]
MLAVVDLNDNTISLYEEGDSEPIAIIKLKEITVRGSETHGDD